MHIDGLLFAIGASPEIPMPDQWLPWVVKNQGNISNQDVDYLMGVLLEQLKFRLSSMRDEQFHLPKACTFGIEDTNSALTQWLTGLLFGHQQLEPIWHNAWKQMQEKAPEEQPALMRDLSHCLRMFSTFANPDLALAQAKENGNSGLEEKMPQIFLSFPKALQQYVDISGKLVGYIPNQFEMYEEPIRPFEKGNKQE